MANPEETTDVETAKTLFSGSRKNLRCALIKGILAMYTPNAFCNDWLPLPPLPLPHILIVQSLQESIRGATYLGYLLKPPC